MLRLYGAPGRASLAPHLLLEEVGARYEFVSVLARRDTPEWARYLALNPHGRVPTLLDGDTAVFESAAICLHLADRHPGAGLAPPVGEAARAGLYQWMLYLSNTLQETFMQYFYGDRFSTEASDAQRIAAKAAERLREIWGVLDEALAAGPYLLGERPSVADLYLLMLATWQRDAVRPLAHYPRVARLVASLVERPAVARTLSANLDGATDGWRHNVARLLDCTSAAHG